MSHRNGSRALHPPEPETAICFCICATVSGSWSTLPLSRSSFHATDGRLSVAGSQRRARLKARRISVTRRARNCRQSAHATNGTSCRLIGRWRDIDLRDLADSLRFRGFQKLAVKYATFGLNEMLSSAFIRLRVKELQKYIPQVESSDIVR